MAAATDSPASSISCSREKPNSSDMRRPSRAWASSWLRYFIGGALRPPAKVYCSTENPVSTKVHYYNENSVST